jgi:hypothetical protein
MTSDPKIGTASNVFWIAITIAAALAWAFWFQALAWHEARQMGKSDACLALVPGPLLEQSATRTAGSRQTYFGYEFEIPWPAPQKVKQTSTLVDLVFRGGFGAVFWNPAERHNFIHDVTANRQRLEIRNFLGAVIGRDAARSDYNFLKGQLEVTPDQISPMQSRRDANSRLTLLRMKSVDCSQKPSAFYSFKWRELNCFQIGDPSKDFHVEVRCFDSGDREFNFLFGVRKGGSSLKISQADINRVVQSVRPAAAPSPQPTAPDKPKN